MLFSSLWELKLLCSQAWELKTPNATCPCPTLKTDVKFVSALNKKIISNACLWRLIRRLCEVFFLFGEFLPIGDPKKINPILLIQRTFVKNNGQKLLHLEVFFFPSPEIAIFR